MRILEINQNLCAVLGKRVGVATCRAGRDAPARPAWHVHKSLIPAQERGNEGQRASGASSRATLSVLRPFPTSLGYLHFRTFCRRATADAPECIYRRRRCTGRHHRRCLRRIARERVPTSHTRGHADTPSLRRRCWPSFVLITGT